MQKTSFPVGRGVEQKHTQTHIHTGEKDRNVNRRLRSVNASLQQVADAMVYIILRNNE